MRDREPTRRDRLIRERVHDPYKPRRHLQDPTVCTDCGAVYRDGRWRWGDPPADAHRDHCPACRRQRDRYPAGLVSLGGDYLRAHRTEILDLVRDVEAREKAEHPIQRILGVEEQEDGLLVSTADQHLARAIGEALHHAHHGVLDYHYVEEDARLRVRWTRSA